MPMPYLGKPLDKRCGNAVPECGYTHQSFTSVCRTLIDNLPDKAIPSSPRSTCYDVAGVACCISWGKVIDRANFPALRYAANKVMDACHLRNPRGRTWCLARRAIPRLEAPVFISA